MIHELLSNPGWINPQIDFLLYLQNIREQFGGSDFFIIITMFGEFLIPTLVMCIVYWCVDFKSGLYLITLNVLNLLAVQYFKLSACIYRPWIISDKVHPVQSAMLKASGYSFPSGHTAIASMWGGCAYIFRKKHLVSALFIFLVLLIAFSRIYVGVHTPQDVIISLIVIFITVFAADKILKWCEKDKERYLYTLFIINCLIALAVIYVIFKKYPLEYVNGKLLVDPQKAVYGAIINSGWICGLINGALLCARYFPINMNVSLKAKIIRAIVGIILFTPMYCLLEAYVYHYSGQSFVTAFVATYATAILITGVYPYIFRKFKIFN